MPESGSVAGTGVAVAGTGLGVAVFPGADGAVVGITTSGVPSDPFSMITGSLTAPVLLPDPISEEAVVSVVTKVIVAEVPFVPSEEEGTVVTAVGSAGVVTAGS